MKLIKRFAPVAGNLIPTSSTQEAPGYGKTDVEAVEAVQPSNKWRATEAATGDVAMALFHSPAEGHGPIDPTEERRLVWKIDFMILPYLAVCYAFFYIDKTTLSYAAIFGIREDLQLVGAQYSWLSSIFYFGFLAWALPTNLLLQRLPVAKYLGFNIFLWGFFLMLQAAATNFASLAALRALAGAAEACSDPAFMLITAMWYTRRQQPIRIGLWYTANGVGIALGGLLGFGIGHVRGALASWKYEFLIIGALCSTWGLIMLACLPDSPVTARALSDPEKRLAVERLRDNQTGVENKRFKPYQIREAVRDPKTALFFVIGVAANVPNGGISNFGTLIIRGFGFDELTTTLMQVPYGAVIALSILLCVWLNDRAARTGHQTRCWFIMLFLLPNIAGAFGLRFLPQGARAGRLVCYYLTGPYNAAFSMVLSLSTANTAGHTKKVVTNAVLFLGYCTGNIIGPFFYLSNQSPEYPLGIWSMIVSHLVELVSVLALRLLLAVENKRRDKLQNSSERDLDATAFSDMTDRENINFRYIY